MDKRTATREQSDPVSPNGGAGSAQDGQGKAGRDQDQGPPTTMPHQKVALTKVLNVPVSHINKPKKQHWTNRQNNNQEGHNQQYHKEMAGPKKLALTNAIKDGTGKPFELLSWIFDKMPFFLRIH